MNLDSINDKDTSFNVYITKILHTVNELYQDPFYRVSIIKLYENLSKSNKIKFIRISLSFTNILRIMNQKE